MSEKGNNLSVLLQLALSFGLGLISAILCTAAFASLMVNQELSQTTVWPLATAAVSVGSLLSGWLMAALQKSRGLVWGSAEGLLLALLLLALQTVNGNLPDKAQALRLGLILLFGAAGGYCGMLKAERKHHH